MHLHRAEFTPLSRILWRIVDVATWMLWCAILYFGVFVGSEFAQAFVLVTGAMVVHRYLDKRRAYCTCRFQLHLEPAVNSNLTVLTLYDGGRITRKEFIPFLPDGDDPTVVARDTSWPGAACRWGVFLLMMFLPVSATVGTACDVKSASLNKAAMAAVVAAATIAATVAAKAAATATASVFHATPESKVSRPSYQSGTYDKGKWTVEEARPGYLKLKLKGTRKEYVIPATRINSALHLLDPDHIASTLSSGECRCSRDCRDHLSQNELIEIRLKWNLKYASMPEVENAVSCMLRAGLVKDKAGNTVPRYVWSNKELCPAYFAAALGVGRNKGVDITKLAVEGGSVKPHASRGVQKTTCGMKTPVSIGFWDYYLEQFCSGWEGKKYFPAGSSSFNIYHTQFPVWFDKVKESQPDLEKPGLSTFRKALKDPRFNDVKRAPKHTHCRCDTCEELKNTMSNNISSSTEYINAKKRKEAHAADVQSWRALEEHAVLRAAHRPSEYAFYRGDDTEAVEFPKPGHRPLKSSANKSKLKVSV